MNKLDALCAGKVAVVTGAGSGIGRSIARLLGQHGARVHCADINGEAAERVATELENAQAHAVDVTDIKAVQALADSVFSSDGRVDFLFNNAGIGHAAFVVDTKPEDWRRVLDINVMGVVNGLHAFLPRMREQKSASHIINTASAAGLVSIPRMAPYCASKHAVVGLSQSLAAELNDTSVNVTILCPGIINTDIVASTIMTGETQGHQAKAVEFYKKKGASPDKVAVDVMNAVRKGNLFCITPRTEVGIGWLSQRLSPRLAAVLARMQMKQVLSGG